MHFHRSEKKLQGLLLYSVSLPSGSDVTSLIANAVLIRTDQVKSHTSTCTHTQIQTKNQFSHQSTCLSFSRYFHTKLQGPLTMHPPAEDNYGMDACSLLCLHSNPPVLVVATSSSVLHHCIVLTSQDGQDAEVSHIN